MRKCENKHICLLNEHVNLLNILILTLIYVEMMAAYIYTINKEKTGNTIQRRRVEL